MTAVQDTTRTLHDLALEVWLDADGDLDAAVRMMRQRITGDRQVFQAVMTEALRLAILETIRREAAERNPTTVATASDPDAGLAPPTSTVAVHSEVAAPTRPASAPGHAIIQGLRQVAALNLLNFTLSSGQRLGESTGDDLLREAVSCELLAAAKQREARWFRLIVDRLSDRASVVEKELRHEDLQGLLQQAMRHGASESRMKAEA